MTNEVSPYPMAPQQSSSQSRGRGIYAGASKKKVLEDEKNVKATIRKSVLKMRKIHFLVMVEKPQPNASKTLVTIICGAPRKTRAVKKKMRMSCECFDSGHDLFEIPEGQIFEIQLNGGLEETPGDTNLTLIFKNTDYVSKRSFEITNLDELTRSVEILSVMRSRPLIEVEKDECVGCCWFSNKKTVLQISEEYTEKKASLVTIPFRVTKEDPKEEDGYATVETLDEEDKCIIPALKWKNLRETMAEVTPDEAFQLALQLALRPEAVDEIREQSSDTDFAYNIIRKWRYRVPVNHQAVQIHEAFLAIGKDNLAARMSSQGLDECHDTENNTLT